MDSAYIGHGLSFGSFVTFCRDAGFYVFYESFPGGHVAAIGARGVDHLLARYGAPYPTRERAVRDALERALIKANEARARRGKRDLIDKLKHWAEVAERSGF